MRLFLGAALAVTCVSGSALADEHFPQCFDKGALAFVDCPNSGYDYYGYDWSGLYIGAHVGFADLDVSGVFDPGEAAVVGSAFEPAGLIGGAQVGYNIQEGAFVLGFELDASFGDMKDAASAISGGDENRVSAEVTGFGSVRARMGVAMDNVMPFISAGAGLVSYELQVDDIDGGVSRNEEDTVLAGVFGAGLEIGVSEDVTLRGEGLYYYIEEDLGFTDSTGVPGELTVDDLWSLRGAVNMRF